MRLLISVFFLFVFLGSQAPIQACLADCSHHQKTKVSHSSNHDCCDQTKPSQDSKTKEDCQLNCCFKSADIEISALTVDSSSMRKKIDRVMAFISPKSIILMLKLREPRTDYRKVSYFLVKVPLYIIYQKLLLP